jgi:hypothetical protein
MRATLADGFVGRTAELALLHRRLSRSAGSDTGTALVIRGRRQVGKSRLAPDDLRSLAREHANIKIEPLS